MFAVVNDDGGGTRGDDRLVYPSVGDGKDDITAARVLDLGVPSEGHGVDNTGIVKR